MDETILRVYDFDGTIYDGNSTMDFLFFYLSRHPFAWLKLPFLAALSILLWLDVISLTYFFEKIFCIFKRAKNIERDVELFWEKNSGKIRVFYNRQRQPNDIVISASPYFLLEPICKKLGVGTLLASQYDVEKGRFFGKLCYGGEKLHRLNEIKVYRCDEFYTDSLKDAPLIKMADRGFLVDNKGISLIWKR